VREALDQSGGNQSEAARLLGVSRTTIWKYAKPG
jgi:transcriptional regulator of acetoin/glycerol metabolism